MIVVLGRPGLTTEGRLDRPTGRIAVAASAAGGRVEVVGSVGDDGPGDSVIVELGSSGIGHAAVLRDPAGATPIEAEVSGRLARLEAADIDLGLRYIAECDVLVVAEPLPADAMRVAAEAAAYHGAALIVLRTPDAGDDGSALLPDDATVLEAPEESGGAFDELVGRYAALLDAGEAPAAAWSRAAAATGWEHAVE